MSDRVTTKTIRQMKQEGKKITMLTAYDFTTAAIMDETGIDMILIGDSLGMVVLGYDSTLPVKLEDVIYHTKAVTRAVKRALVVGDMPFMTYQVDKKEAVRNAGCFLQEGGAQAVKLEGGVEIAETVEKVVKAGIPVQGHIGLTPQSIHQFGSYRARGRTYEQAEKLLKDAMALEEAGVFSIVLECIPFKLAAIITKSVTVPTIGIGAGPYCDGQVLVTPDMLGYTGLVSPKFVKKYACLEEETRKAINHYIQDVQQDKFPTEEHSYGIDEEIIRRLKTKWSRSK